MAISKTIASYDEAEMIAMRFTSEADIEGDVEITFSDDLLQDAEVMLAMAIEHLSLP